MVYCNRGVSYVVQCNRGVSYHLMGDVNWRTRAKLTGGIAAPGQQLAGVEHGQRVCRTYPSYMNIHVYKTPLLLPQQPPHPQP